METVPPADDRTASNAACLPEAFFQHVLSFNPFTLNRATADGGDRHDVVKVHSDVFVRLTDLAGEAARLRRGLGVLLTGDAGAGKSHVLGRLARWAAVEERACFVVVHGLQTDPELLPAAVLRSAGVALAGKPGAAPARTPLYRLMHAAARSAMKDKDGRHSWERVGRAFARLADRLAPTARRVPEGRAVFDLLFRFFRAAARTAEGKEDGSVPESILRLLSGGMLDAEEARKLHLPLTRHRDDPVVLTDPEWARQGITALAALSIADSRPFVLVIDQAEELDTVRFAALARFLKGLLDQAPGLLAVTAADSPAVQRWRDRGEVPESAWDRLAQFTLEPARLKPAEGLAVVRRRLDDALSRFKELEFLYRLRADAPLFPLHLDPNPCGARAREVLDSARAAWSTEQEVLRREGGAEWLAGWAERVAISAEKPEVAEPDAESSLTREQVLAAITVRARASAPPPLPAEPEVRQPAAEADPFDTMILPAGELQPAKRVEAAPPTDEPPDTVPIGEMPAGGEPSLTADQLAAAVAHRSRRPADVSEDTELSLSVEQIREAMARGNEPAAPPPDETPSATAEVDVAEPAAEAPPPPPPLERRRRATDTQSMPAMSLADFEISFPEPPTVPDPAAVRPRRNAEPQPPAPAPAPEPAAFAPSGRNPVLSPRACPQPPAPAAVPTPREETVDRVIAGVVDEHLAARGSRREAPADAERVAELILNLLQQCRAADPGYGVLQAERLPAWKAAPPACDFVVRQQAEGNAVLRTGVLVLTASRATAIAGYLRRLTTEDQPFDRLFLITEEGVGLPLGPRGQEYLQELQQRTAVQLHTVEMTFAEYAGMSALRSAVRKARNGALAADGERITEAEAVASHHRRHRYVASRFLSALLFDSPPTELIRRSPALAP
jgi:hypothetical protein